jgi:predicted transcriptional regulator
MLKALAVETRVKIIELLKSEEPLGAKKIAELVGITPAAVSQYLKIFKQAEGKADTLCLLSRTCRL